MYGLYGLATLLASLNCITPLGDTEEFQNHLIRLRRSLSSTKQCENQTGKFEVTIEINR